jgi:hypothetical protein
MDQDTRSDVNHMVYIYINQSTESTEKRWVLYVK